MENYKYLYVIKTVDEDDTQKLYDIFAEYPVKRSFGENDKDLILELQSTEKINDIYKVIGDIPTAFVNVYNLVGEWEELSGEGIKKEDRIRLYSKITDLQPVQKKNMTFMICGIILGIVMLACSFLLKVGILKYIAIGIIILGCLLTLIVNKKNDFKKWLKDAVNEEWIICECVVASIDAPIHRPNTKTAWRENVFKLSQNDKCFKYVFTGQELKIGEKVKLFIRKNVYTSPVEETLFYNDKEQIYQFNGVFIVIPNSYKASKKVLKELNNKKYNKSKKEKISKKAPEQKPKAEKEERVISFEESMQNNGWDNVSIENKDVKDEMQPLDDLDNKPSFQDQLVLPQNEAIQTNIEEIKDLEN